MAVCLHGWCSAFAPEAIKAVTGLEAFEHHQGTLGTALADGQNLLVGG